MRFRLKGILGNRAPKKITNPIYKDGDIFVYLNNEDIPRSLINIPIVEIINHKDFQDPRMNGRDEPRSCLLVRNSFNKIYYRPLNGIDDSTGGTEALNMYLHSNRENKIWSRNTKNTRLHEERDQNNKNTRLHEEKNYYKILEINRDADTATIKNAYRQMSLKYHPDRNQNNPEEAQQKQIAIVQAYEVLSDPYKRIMYDAGLTEFFTSGSSVNGLVSLLVLGGVYLVLKNRGRK